MREVKRYRSEICGRGYKDVVVASDYDALRAELAEWQQASERDLAKAIELGTKLDDATADLAECKAQLQIKDRAARTAFDHIFGVVSEYWDGNYERDAARAQGREVTDSAPPPVPPAS